MSLKRIVLTVAAAVLSVGVIAPSAMAAAAPIPTIPTLPDAMAAMAAHPSAKTVGWAAVASWKENQMRPSGRDQIDEVIFLDGAVGRETVINQFVKNSGLNSYPKAPNLFMFDPATPHYPTWKAAFNKLPLKQRKQAAALFLYQMAGPDS